MSTKPDPVSEVMALANELATTYARKTPKQSNAIRAALEAKVRELEKDAARYRHMRNNAVFRDRNGPGLYWYLPMFGHGGSGEQLDAAIDSARSQNPTGATYDR